MVVKKKLAGAGKVDLIPGGHICGVKLTLLTGPVICPWPRESNLEGKIKVRARGSGL